MIWVRLPTATAQPITVCAWSITSAGASWLSISAKR